MHIYLKNMCLILSSLISPCECLQHKSSIHHQSRNENAFDSNSEPLCIPMWMDINPEISYIYVTLHQQQVQTDCSDCQLPKTIM